MAKIPVKKPIVKAPAKKAVVKTPAMTLEPGEKKKLDIKAVKLKIAKIENLKTELSKLESAQRMAGASGVAPKKFANKALTAKMAEFHAMLDAEETKLRAEIDKVTADSVKTQAKKFGPLVETIKKECSEALAAYKSAGQVLFRVVKTGKSNPPAYVGRSWTERKTVNSDPVAQQLYDYCLQKLGITALRKNSIFATSDNRQAQDFGTLYVIIPKNGFQFSWSRTTADIVIEDVEEFYKSDLLEKIEDKIDRLAKKSPKAKDAAGWEFHETLLYDGYEEAMKYLREIGFPGVEKLTLDNMINWKYVRDEYQPDSKDLKGAIQSGNEVLISGEYYAFDLKKFKDILSALLGIRIQELRQF